MAPSRILPLSPFFSVVLFRLMHVCDLSDQVFLSSVLDGGEMGGAEEFSFLISGRHIECIFNSL